MIKVENIKVYNIARAVYSARNPLNSWSKSDSDLEHDILGKNDLDLAHRLYVAGTEHRKYLRQIFVSMDITGPIFWLSELDTYKVGTVRNSCSFMHKGVSKPFTVSDFSIHDDRVYEVLTPPEKKTYVPEYPYETDEYRDYECQNGRKYKVFRNGRVFAYAHEYTDTMGRHRTFDEVECKPCPNRCGYYELNMGGRNGEKWLLHRLVATVWHDNPENYSTVNHINGNKNDNSAENLEWCSLQENIRKGFEDGLYDSLGSLRVRYGTWKRTHRLLTPLKRAELLLDYRQGVRGVALAEKYGLTTNQVNTMVFGSKNKDTELFLLCYIWERIIDNLNDLRDEYLETKDPEIFNQIRCLLPSGYNQRFTYTMNYENVVTMIHQREYHRLPEWRTFTDILKTLPYAKEIMGE